MRKRKHEICFHVLGPQEAWCSGDSWQCRKLIRTSRAEPAVLSLMIPGAPLSPEDLHGHNDQLWETKLLLGKGEVPPSQVLKVILCPSWESRSLHRQGRTWLPVTTGWWHPCSGDCRGPEMCWVSHEHPWVGSPVLAQMGFPTHSVKVVSGRKVQLQLA